MFTVHTRSAWLWLSGQVSGYQNADEAGNENTPPLRLGWVRSVRRSCCEEQRVLFQESNTRGDGKGAKGEPQEKSGGASVG